MFRLLALSFFWSPFSNFYDVDFLENEFISTNHIGIELNRYRNIQNSVYRSKLIGSLHSNHHFHLEPRILFRNWKEDEKNDLKCILCVLLQCVLLFFFFIFIIIGYFAFAVVVVIDMRYATRLNKFSLIVWIFRFKSDLFSMTIYSFRIFLQKYFIVICFQFDVFVFCSFQIGVNALRFSCILRQTYIQTQIFSPSVRPIRNRRKENENEIAILFWWYRICGLRFVREKLLNI